MGNLISHKCWNNPNRKVASSADIVSDGRRLVTAISAETSCTQFKGDNAFNRGRGNNRGRRFDRGNKRGHCRGIGTRREHQLTFCKVK